MNFQFAYKEYAEALYLALCDDAFYLTMEKSAGNNESSREAMLRYLEYSMKEAQEYGELYFPEENKYGVSLWLKPLNETRQAQKSVEKKDFLLDQMGSRSLDTYNAIVDFMSTQSEPFVGEAFWYLSIIGILPEFQGQGVGAELMETVLKQTDKLGVPTYLETFTPRNMTFYNRLGYKAVAS
ncbi:MAG: GNAT family N-acetyltransferase, partial [Desulfobacteraceae bacterium]|nr:GNAT family N-acetyltransferase [Desulfobacteraceae bacterium]